MKRMEALLNRRKQIMEGLLTASIDMLEACRRGDFEKLDERLEARSLLLAELHTCIQNLNESANRDSVWLDQLAYMKTINEEIVRRVEERHHISGKLLDQVEKAKSEWVKAYQIDPRGHQLEAKG